VAICWLLGTHNSPQSAEKELPRLGERRLRTASTLGVQPAATSPHKCGKKIGAETTGCAVQCEADERKILEKHVCALGRETQGIFAAVVPPL